MQIAHWLEVFSQPVDMMGFILFVLIFPVYHGLYPWLMRVLPNRAARVRLDRLRRSWIEGLIMRRDLIAAAQQTRNLTMVNSLMASSSLILMGFTSNILIRWPQVTVELPHLSAAQTAQEAIQAKLLLLIMILGVAFGYSMTSLRHLGHFNLVIGADPELVEELEGSSVDYFSSLINRASNRYTLAVRCLYSASAAFFWLFDPWLFVAVTLFWGIKFIILQDFVPEQQRTR
jgi:uncharacterized membrane protein